MKWEKCSAKLSDILASGMAIIPAQRRVMFGCPAYFINGNMFAGLFGDGIVSFLGLNVPVPGVFKGVNLAGSVGAVLLVKEGIVVLRGIKGRIEVNEVNELILDVSLQDVEVVAVIKCAHK